MKKLWSIGMAFALIMMMVEVVYADSEQTWTVEYAA